MGGHFLCSFLVPCLFHLESADSAHPPPVAAHVGGSLWQGAPVPQRKNVPLRWVLYSGRAVGRAIGRMWGCCGSSCARVLGRGPPPPPPVTTPPRFPGRTPVVGGGGAPTGPPGGAWSRPATVATRPPLRGRPRRQQPTAPWWCARRGWAELVAAGGSTEGGTQRRTLWTLPFSYFFHPKVTAALSAIAAVVETRTKRDRPLLYATVFS